jgi:glycerate kinase
MRIVVAPQEFKGTLTAAQAAAAMAEGVARALPEAEAIILPLADGGPGTVAAIVQAAGGEIRRATVRDPLERLIEAEWGLLADGTAVIEMAAAAGLVLVSEEERDPGVTTTLGVGDLVRAALDAGSRRIVIGLGGSATNDGGAGMAQALGARLLDAQGRELSPGGAALANLTRIDASALDERLAATEVLGASDVRNALCGAEGASIVYGPQKGASPEMAQQLDRALRNYAQVIERDLRVKVAEAEGAGAAGGLGAGLIAFLRASIRPGIDVVAETMRLRARLRGADLVLTGEGTLDGQTGYGKTVAGVARLAGEAGVPVLVVPGALGPGWEALQPFVEVIEPVVGAVMSAGQAAASPARALTLTVQRALTDWRRSGRAGAA